MIKSSLNMNIKLWLEFDFDICTSLWSVKTCSLCIEL